MSVLVYTEQENGKYKKAALELASYGKAVADKMGTSVQAISINGGDASELGTYGVSTSMNASYSGEFNAQNYAEIIKEAAEKASASVVILSSSANSRSIAPLLAVKLNAGYVSNAVAVPNTDGGFTVKRSAFTNKAFAHTAITTDTKIIGLSQNSFGLVESPASVSSEELSVSTEEPKVKVQSVDKASDKVSIADAEIVVSGGRGLKGPENWGMVEELAEVLGAATACSKPVSDLGWRPHSEHVGQTGKPVASNLYIAIGISGAIQHLAGINASKVKVVINTDPEAPFFKAADYGVVGDAFEVVPKLTQKLKEFKAQNA